MRQSSKNGISSQFLSRPQESPLDRAKREFTERFVSELESGQRADGTPQRWEPWTDTAFAGEIPSRYEGRVRDNGRTITPNTVGLWRRGTIPPEIHPILDAFYGDDPRWEAKRRSMLVCWKQARGILPLDDDDQYMPRPSHSPVPPARCYGRDDVLSHLIAHLADNSNPFVLVLGSPGIGKTTLTLQAAVSEDVVAKFGKRRWVVELETVLSASGFEREIVRAIGLDPSTARLDEAVRALEVGPALLVLDNFESPWEADRALTEQLLRRLREIRGLAVVASLRGEQVPHEITWSKRLTLAPLSQADSQALFLELASNISATDRYLQSLMCALGGIPQAICLVAKRAENRSRLCELWSEWRNIGPKAARLIGAKPERLTALDISIELSLQSRRLSQYGRMFFAILGQLPAGVRYSDLVDLAGIMASTAADELIAVGLAYRRDDRIQMLPPIRLHASCYYKPTGADRRWSQHYLKLAKQLGSNLDYRGGGEAAKRLTPEVANVEAALADALSDSTGAEIRSAVVGLSRVIRRVGLGRSACFERALTELVDRGLISDAATCEKAIADIALAQGDLRRANTVYVRAMAKFHEVSDRVNEAWCLLNLGIISLSSSDMGETPRIFLSEALSMFRDEGLVRGEASSFLCLGDFHFFRKEYPASEQNYTMARSLFHSLGHFRGEARALLSCVRINLAYANLSNLDNMIDEAEHLFREVNDRSGCASCLLERGDLCRERLQFNEASHLYERAKFEFRSVGSPRGTADSLRRLGDLDLWEGRHSRAREWYVEALEIARGVPDYRLIATLAGRITATRLDM